jgi:membrane protein implicated in regulation of membrane protease activity
MSAAFLFWIVLALVLLAVELHHLAFFAMFGAAGAAAAAIVALISPDAVAVQILVAIGVAVAGVIIVRPYVSKAFDHRGPDERIAGVHGGLISARGITLDEVGRDADIGHVRILGENWLAVAADAEPIPPQTPVIVTDITGTTLTVRPAEHGAPSP